MINSTGLRESFVLPKAINQPTVELNDDESSAIQETATNQAATIDFYDVFTEAVDGVRMTFAEAKESTTDALIGQGTPHNAMLSLAKADLTFRFMTQTRNKVVEAYREFMSLQM